MTVYMAWRTPNLLVSGIESQLVKNATQAAYRLQQLLNWPFYTIWQFIGKLQWRLTLKYLYAASILKYESLYECQ